MVPNTSELLPEPETPVNTVSRRFGSSTLTSLRLFTRAPCTRIRSWRSATCSAGDCVSVLVAMLIVSPSATRGRLRGLRRRRLTRSNQLRAVRLVLPSLPVADERGSKGRRSAVLEQPEDVAVGVGDGGHQAAATYVAHGLLHGGTRGG